MIGPLSFPRGRENSEAQDWVDPDFDPRPRSFYYVRVIEIPTHPWTAYDQKFFEVQMPEGTKVIVQDRAYTSPIWYTPGS